MALSSNQCAPYISVSLYKADGKNATKAADLLAAIQSISEEIAARKGLEKPSFQELSDPKIEKDGMTIAWAHYVERRPPSWFIGAGVTDQLNHVIVVAKLGQLYALLFSDNALRSAVAKQIASSADRTLATLKRFSPTQINKAFVEKKVRTLWLSGTHRRTTIKPDSKILSGLELESSLDPLGDQTYYFSSVRSTMSLSDLPKTHVVGASPGGSRIWIGPTRSWEEFTSTVNRILVRAKNCMDDANRSSKPLPVLASAITGLAGIKQPYGVALIVPEQVNDGTADNAEEDARWLQQFGDAARFEITAEPNSPNFTSDIFWGPERVGRLEFQFEEIPNAELRLKISKIEGFKGDNAVLLSICRNPENLTIYFDTGHTFSRGQFYETQFRDARFTDWRWVKMDTDRTRFAQEKPLDGKRFAVEETGTTTDKSLFGLVARHWPNLEDRGAQEGWLVCDDGAMESADFIHIDDRSTPPELTLIHVKGSGSNKAARGLSVSDYEVVVGQAVKNLRHIDRGLLRTKLAGNAHGVLKDAVWRDGIRQKNRDGFLKMLDGLGSDLKKKVVVLQPSVRQSVFNDVSSKMKDGKLANVRRMQQLDALLLAARADCLALNAEFLVIADDDLQSTASPIPGTSLPEQPALGN